jgi:HSP20 family protein
MVTMTLPIRRGSSFPASLYEPGFRDPFTEFETLWDRMNRLFTGRLYERGGELGTEQSPWVPEIEVDETQERYLVKAELPGVQRDDIELQVDEHSLSVSGGLKHESRQTQPQHAQQDQHAQILHRRAGRFYYRTALPRDVNIDAVTATMRDGVLTIGLPKTKQASHKVAIKN